MNASKSIETLYSIICELKGPVEAKNFVSGVVFDAIDELQEEGLEISSEGIEKKLASCAQDFLEAYKNKNHVA